jgi:hypothetical protein
LSRPPLDVFPANEGSGSVLESSVVLSAAVVRVGWAARTSAAAPATCGVAIEVPLRN